MPAGEKIEYDYDARGRVRQVRSFRNSGTQTTSYAYAASGLLDAVTTPDGVTESYTYDSARCLKTVTRNTPPARRCASGSTMRPATRFARKCA